ncbi:MAG TPA: two-component regulator propeller domain-containing protein, partial [Verrucomicrobiota bacterium]|nr:two-component regulator propeller domain-containing protein [Verrucomicrobiota bacterium]
YRDHRDRLWVGSAEDGLHCLNEGRWTSYTTADGLAHRTVTCLLEDRLGQMWIGTPHGLNRLADGRFTRFGRADGLVVETIQSLFEDSTGNLWVGTSGGGIARYRNERFSPVTTRHGLADNVISQILEDDHGCLWLGSNRGLMRVPLQDLLNCADGTTNAVRCIEYGRDEGLLKAEFTGGFQPNCMKTSDGKLWFCTVGGLVVVDPANVISNSVVPPVHIQRVIVDGQSVGSPHSNEPAAPGNNANGVRTDPFGRVIVPAGARRLEFHYTALSFTAPERVRFRYKLEGWDKEWVEAGTVRAASYTRVSPGSYRFRMTACNEDGLWNQTGATLAVTILPAWWQTTWFRTSLLFVLCGLLFSLHEWRIRLLKQRRLAQELLSCRLISSQEEERKRLARELHDGLGQHLLVIKNLAAMGARSSAEHQSGAEQFETISKLASQVIREVRQITRALRPFELDRLGLTKAIVWLIRPAAESSGIQFDIDVDDLSGAFQRDSEINFYRIVQESIANILKHSKATRACVRIKRDPAEVHVCIRDNGCGFNSSEAPGVGGTGLVSIAERVRILGGRLRVESAPAAGTVLWIVIPVQKSLYGQATNPD